MTEVSKGLVKKRFGVYIPPWRKVEHAHPGITLDFVLKGWIPSKKNMQRPSFNYSWAFKQLKNFYVATPNPTGKQWTQFIVSLIRKIKPYIMNPKKYADWELSAQEIIIAQANEFRQQYEAKGLKYPITRCSVSIRHYWADNRVRDNSNKSETLHDLLVSSGIIVDDNDKCLYKHKAEAQCWKDEISDHITIVYVTAYDW